MKSLIKPKPGDLFYIPSISQSNENGFVIARYIEFIKPNLGHLIEVFDHFYTELPKNISDVDTSKKLFQPIFCSMRFSGIPRWKILFNHPEYDKSESDYKNIAFKFDGSIWIGGESRITENEELQNMEPSICWRMDHIIFRVLYHLKGFLSYDEIMNYDKIPTEYRVDNESAKKKVLEITKIIDNKFRSWG
ncbi:immunity 26 domain-containing protein [Chryseobacterium sp. MEBOG06]|uniref:Imm26 family immunity protein n=1 Tax=unclassified Chryseobacterium TaxID=2593645 RepID=UPI001F28E6B4|nr:MULTISPECIES: Imm26 family immunity protein [unclassified Chryseobacterium]UKB86335.1 immunity 26 domain-containing protein [Chryseobacterium sp. MEBOG06]